MLRRVFLYCTVVLSATALSVAADPPLTLRVLTYNIHHGEGDDRKFDLDRIAKVIQSAKPDLVALQEVDQATKRSSQVDQLARLAELTGLHPAYGKAMDFQGGGYGVGLLSRWPIKVTRTHPLPAGEGTEPRVVLESIIPLSENGPSIRFLVTHVDHRSDPTARTAQIAKIRELFPLKTTDEHPAILAGDLNATPESEVIRSLCADWTDSAAGQPFLTCPADSAKVKIDYILFRPATAWRVVETRALNEPVASDHLPVLTVFEKR